MVDLATETIKTIGRNNGLLDYETMSSAYDGQIYSVLGDTVYNSGGCYVSLSEQHNGRRSIELTGDFLVEFADADTGRLAITMYDGKYPVDMRWYTPGEGLGESLPEAMWRTGRDQRYHTDGNGRVYLVADSPDDYAVLFSCNMDGSDMVEYK